MKHCICWVACGVLSVQAIHAQIPPITNRVQRLVPVDNIAAARSRFPPSNYHQLATNTPEFEEYGLSVMLVQANEMREKWQLDIPKPLTMNDVYFQLKATLEGIDGGIGTRDRRYDWGFTRNSVVHFSDAQYWPRSFRYHDDESARLAKIKSKITAKEAEAIARNALHQLGLTEKGLEVRKTMVHQYQFEESDGTVYPLPIFNVSWFVTGWDDDSPPVSMEISGITTNVAEYSNYAPTRPRLPMPTNYFQMLGLPTNYLETISPLQRYKLGLKIRKSDEAELLRELKATPSQKPPTNPPPATNAPSTKPSPFHKTISQ